MRQSDARLWQKFLSKWTLDNVYAIEYLLMFQGHLICLQL